MDKRRIYSSPLIERGGDALPQNLVFGLEPVVEVAAFFSAAFIIQLICAHRYFSLDNLKQEPADLF